MRRNVWAMVGIAALVAGGAAHAATTPKSVRVTMETADGRDGGEIVLVDAGKNALRVEVDMQNLDPGAHAIHFHQNASCDVPTFATAGGHLTAPNGKGGNVLVLVNANDAGKAHQSFVVPRFTLELNAPNSVLAHGGTSLLVYNGRNDPKTEAPESSAKPEACGIVSLKNGLNTVPRLQKTPPLAAPSNH